MPLPVENKCTVLVAAGAGALFGGAVALLARWSHQQIASGEQRASAIGIKTYGALVWNLRCDLAAAYRACANFGFNEAVYNHLTVVVPDTGGQFLVNAFGVAWGEVTASNLLQVDTNGDVVVGEGAPNWDAKCALATAAGVHGMLHLKGGPERNAVFHTHQKWTTALQCRVDSELLMCSQTALRFYKDVAYETAYDGLITGNEEGERLHSIMGDKHVLMLKNHGVVVSGQTVADALFRLYYVEKSAEIQLSAAAGGSELQLITTEAAEKFRFKDLAQAEDTEGTGLALDGVTRQARKGPHRFFEAIKRGLRASSQDRDFCT